MPSPRSYRFEVWPADDDGSSQKLRVIAARDAEVAVRRYVVERAELLDWSEPFVIQARRANDPTGAVRDFRVSTPRVPVVDRVQIHEEAEHGQRVRF